MPTNGQLITAVTLATATAYYFWTYWRRRRDIADHSPPDTDIDDRTIGDRLWDCVRAVGATIGCRDSGLGLRPVLRVRRALDTHYVQVPKHLVPRVIGRAGENIKDLERRTNTSVHFANEFDGTASGGTGGQDSPVDPGAGGDEPDAPRPVIDPTIDDNDCWESAGGPGAGGGDQPPAVKRYARRPDYRTMAIRGDPDCVRAAIAEVQALIDANAYDRVDVPYGCDVVGIDGHRIRTIEDKSGARLKLEGSRYAQHRVLLITGTPAERQLAGDLVRELIDGAGSEANDS